MISKKLLSHIKKGVEEVGAFKRRENFSKIANIQPTRGVQRQVFEFLGKDISEWDLFKC